MTIQTTLKSIGFEDKEIKVYLALLKSGKNTPAVLAKITGINRATVYNIAKSLTLKGIVAEDLSGKTLYFVPLPISSLEHIFDRQQRELREKEVLAKKAIEQLSLISAGHTYPVPKIRFIEEDGLKDFLYDNIRKWQKDALRLDGTIWGFQDKTFAQAYKEWIEYIWHTKEAKDERYKVYHLTNVSDFEKTFRKYSKRHIKFLEKVDFTSTVIVAGDYLFMVVTKQHPFYLVEIHDKTLAHNMREVLRELWDKEN